MFGHGALDIPMKTFNASPYCSSDSNKTAIDKVIGCPPWRGDYYANFIEGVEPDWNSTWDEDAEIDRQFELDTQQYQAKNTQAKDIMLGTIWQLLDYGEGEQSDMKNLEYRWCHNKAKYGTKLYWWLYDTTNDEQLASGQKEASALSHSEILDSQNGIPDVLETLRIKEVDCADEGKKENESFNYGNGGNQNEGSGNQGNGGGSDDTEMKPLFCWKCPAGYILGGLGLLGAGYVYFMIKHPGYWVAGQAIGTGGNLLGKMFGK